MKKLSAACMILGLSLFVGGCSNDQIDDHIISLQDKISNATSSDSASQETSDSSQEERVYMDEITGTLQNFDGKNLTISSDGETYVFDVSNTRLECKYGVVFSDQVSIIYQGQLSGTDISTISPIKVTDKYHNETPLENRTLKGKVKKLTSNALVIVTEKGNTVTFPVTGVRQYYKKGIKAGRWVYVHFRGKFINETIVGDKQYDGSFTKVISVSDTDPLKVPAATPTPSPAPKKKEQHLRAKIVSVSTSTMTVVPQTTGSELTVPLTSVPVYFKGGMAPGSYVNIIYTGKFNGESTNGMKIRGITGEDPDTLSIRNISSTVTGTILGTTTNTVLIQTYDGVKILCSRENVQDLSTSGMEEGADLRVTFNPAKSRTSNIYTCIKFEDP
jgi:RNase P/RNase MRP subunit p29